MSHPIFHIKAYYQDVENGKYSDIGAKASDKWRELSKEIEPHEFRGASVKRVGELVASKARIIDKVNLYKTLIADGIGAEAGTLSDDDAVMILAGWAGEMRRRFVGGKVDDE